MVVQAARLTEDLQLSRARLVTTREEERRRLRRDLHDGLGPNLAAVVLKLNAAQRMTDEEERGRLLAETRAETRAAIAEVRRLVDDLRPPAIDEVGLVGAIRQRAAALCVGNDLSCEITGPARLPVLPAAVEVAAYRIASEALTNVVRHAGATRCQVRIAVNGAFELTVTDNGRGAVPGGAAPGVGWTSMRERAAELGGTLHGEHRADGVLVRAVLPLPSDASASWWPRDGSPDHDRGRRRPPRLPLRAPRRCSLAFADLDVVGEAATGTEAVDLIAQLEPDVVVMDLRMPDLDGIEATRRLMRQPRPPGVIVLTMFEDDESVFAAMRAGPLGYLLKGADEDEIVRAVRAVAAGEAIFGPEIARRVVAHFAHPEPSRHPAFPMLTQREQEVLRPPRRRRRQRRHRPPSRHQPQDGPQQRVEHLHQAPGQRSVRCHRQGPRRRLRGRQLQALAGPTRHRGGSCSGRDAGADEARSRIRYAGVELHEDPATGQAGSSSTSSPPTGCGGCVSATATPPRPTSSCSVQGLTASPRPPRKIVAVP